MTIRESSFNITRGGMKILRGAALKICRHPKGGALKKLGGSENLFVVCNFKLFGNYGRYTIYCIRLKINMSVCLSTDRQTDMYLFGVLYKDSTLTTISK